VHRNAGQRIFGSHCTATVLYYSQSARSAECY